MKAVSTKPHYDVECLNGIPISDVVSRFDSLKRNGTSLVSTCPWHADEHPSLTLYEKEGENHCHCFACGKGGGPIRYVMQRAGLTFLDACAWLAREFNRGVTFGTPPSVKFNAVQKEKASKPIAQKEVTYIPMEVVDAMVSCESSFVKCMMQVFDSYRVQSIVEDYKLGCYDYGGYEDCVVFPSIDEKGRVHNLKVQHYCCDDHSERFFCSDKGHCYWIGKHLARQGVVAKDAEFDNNCLFGAHLLSRYPGCPVMLVESPKNALVGAAICYDCLWVATGNKGMLTYDNLRCLRNRDVIVYPDRDAISEWKAILSSPRMQALANFTVSDFCERYASADSPKYDIADFIVELTTG